MEQTGVDEVTKMEKDAVRSGKSIFGRAGDESNLTSVRLPYIMRLACC